MLHWFTSPSLRRWGEIVLYALLAASVILLAGPQFLEIAECWVRPQPPAAQVAIGLLAAAVLIGIGHGRWAGSLRVVRWLRYPPHILSVPLGLAFLWIAENCCSGLDGAATASVAPGAPDPWRALRAGTLLLGVGFSVAWECAARLRARPTTLLQTTAASPSTATVLDADSQLLIDWIASDDPVTDFRLDGHGHSGVAERIARRLISDPRASVVLVGPVGSGKSTIGEMTRQHLALSQPKNRTIRFKRISLWPFAFADSAIESILEQALECIKNDVDTLAIAGIPEAYTKAVGSQIPGIAGMLDVVRRRGTPGELLDQIDEVVTAAGIEIVLWIEDLERFAVDRHTAVARQIDQIHSLIYELDSRSSIRVVIASATILERIDPAKIARYIEHVPKIEAAANWARISDFRDSCLSSSPSWIDAAPTTEARSGVFALDGRLAELVLSEELGSQDLGTRAAFAVAASTPRTLKLGLRRTLEVWQVLRGEVDFDDVLAVSLVAAASPRMLSFVDEHIDRLRDGPPTSFDRPNEKDAKRDTNFRRNFEGALSSIKDDRSRTATRALIKFVFPGIESAPNENRDRPQGFASTGPRDYWSRFTAQIPVDASESDQAVLSAVKDWELGGESDLLHHIEDERQSTAVSVFGRRLSERRVYDCLHALCTRLAADKELPVATMTERLTVVRGMLYGRSPRLADLSSAIVDSIRTKSEGDLRVASAIMEVLANSENSWYAGELNHGYLEKIKHAVRGALIKACTTGGEDTSIPKLFTLPPLQLYWLVRSSSLGFRGPIRSLPFEEWPIVAEALASAADIDFAACMPHVLLFLVDSGDPLGMPGMRPAYVVNRFALEELFGAPRIRGILTTHQETPSWSPEFQAKLTTVRNHLDIAQT